MSRTSDNSKEQTRPRDRSSFLDTSIHTEKNEQVMITSIRATDVALGLRRIPAGFFVVLHHSGHRWRTENKPSPVDHDAVEWTEPIPIPSDLSAIIRLEVYASFEFQPTLGTGEQLRELTTTVQQLLGRSRVDTAFTFSPGDGDVVSPCSSILITVGQRKCTNGDSSPSMVLDRHCPTTDSQGELENATNDGHTALSRYRKHGEKRDLERSVEEFKRAIRICPQNHPCHAVAQSNLATAEFILCQVEGRDALLPHRLYCNALAARPVGHVDRPSTLIQLAAVHLARFDKLRDNAGGVQAEKLLREAMEISSAKSRENRVARIMLQLHGRRRGGAVSQDDPFSTAQDATSCLTDEDLRISYVGSLQRFQRFGDLADLQEAIRVLQELVRYTSLGDDRYRARLGNLGTALSQRFEHLGESRDLEDAISMQMDVVALTPHGDPGKPATLGNLGNSFRTRFGHSGQLCDLDDAISRQRDAVDLTPHGHPLKPGHLNNLSNSLLTRFKHLGRLSDLGDAISSQRDAVDLAPHGHPHKPAILNGLGDSFLTRFERLGQLRDLEDAISSQREAVNLTPRGHPDKPVILDNLGNSLFTRFKHLGHLSDLEDAISSQRDAIDLTPCGHSDKPIFLSDLGNSLSVRFERLGQLSDLEEAISRQKDAVHLTPHGHPEKPNRLHNLSISFLTSFKRLGQLKDLEDAISSQRDAVDLTPSRHPDKPNRIHNLSDSFLARFERLGQLSDLESAISTQKDVVDLTPHGHPDRPSRLHNLGNSYLTRFKRLGHPSDLEDAISRHSEAVTLIPHSHPDQPTYFSNLGNSLLNRFGRFRRLSDLEGAILKQREAVDLIPPGHPDRPGYLSNLGNSLKTRFERLGQLNDLEGAISRFKDAVDLTPHGHPNKLCYLNNLGISFVARFRSLGQLSDLEDAILWQKEVVDLTPHDHPEKPHHLANLGDFLGTRYECLERLGDLEDAFSMHKAAVDLTPNSHPKKPARLTDLSTSFRTRFERLGRLGDLEDAISRQRDAVDLTPHDHPDKSDYLNRLGSLFEARFKHLGEPDDMENSISLYLRAASGCFGSIRVRFRASQNWISCARQICHHSLLHAYSVAINLLPQLAWIGLSLSHRYFEITRGADVVREAAAAALELGLPETAVEWLEQGRSIVWGELFQLRRPYEELSSAHPDHAHRLRELSVALDDASATHERSLSMLSEETQSATESLQAEADRHRMLAIERDELLQEIRRLPGFERFLLRKEFSQLRAAAHSGPVVLLNAAQHRCDALIVLANLGHAIHVPLPSFTFKRSTQLQSAMQVFLRHAREGRPAPLHVSWESFLSPLWKCVVEPVLNGLAFSTLENPSRIFWCPTGPFMFLPIHAAGLYDPVCSQPGNKVFDFVISSYTPTLSNLEPLANLSAASSDNLRLLAVRQPPSDGQSPLQGVVTELQHIEAIIRNSPSARTTFVESFVGTVEDVLALMKDTDWVHFACHGVQDDKYPIDSGLCLANGRRLKVSDIIALSRPRGGLAFLSACQTAKGDKNLSDEAVHIAAGMLFAGYGGVIGTMWSISDRLAPDVASDVYEELFRDGKRPDYREAARALHEAIKCARDRGESFFDWVPFIHVGL